MFRPIHVKKTVDTCIQGAVGMEMSQGDKIGVVDETTSG